jgi:hypothetical protein
MVINCYDFLTKQVLKPVVFSTLPLISLLLVVFTMVLHFSVDEALLTFLIM